MRCWLFNFIVFILVSLLSQRAMSLPVYLHPCHVETDPEISSEYFSTCLEGSAGVAAEQRSKSYEKDHPPYVGYAKGKITHLPLSWLVLRASGHAITRQRRSAFGLTTKDVSQDELILQLGNSAIHRHRLFVGKATMAFGLNHPATDYFSHQVDSEGFYGKRIRHAGYTYDNQKDLTATLSAGYEGDQTGLKEERLLQASLRIAYDIAALEGTRLLASFRQDEIAARKASFAMVNQNGRGDLSTFEVIRTWSFYPYDPRDFSQLIRLNWTGKSSSSLRVIVGYEDATNLYRFGSIGCRYKIIDHLYTSLEGGYHKSESKDSPNYWTVMYKLETEL